MKASLSAGIPDLLASIPALSLQVKAAIYLTVTHMTIMLHRILPEPGVT